jgi:hypothetical protein
VTVGRHVGDGDMDGGDGSRGASRLLDAWGVNGGLVVVSGLDSGLSSVAMDSRLVGFPVMGS